MTKQERIGPGWEGYIDGDAPVQGCGYIDGYPWYFRARWSAYSFEVVDDRSVDPEILPVVGDGHPGWLIEEDWGTGMQASYMSMEAAWQLIERCFEMFRSGQLRYWPVE